MAAEGVAQPRATGDQVVALLVGAAGLAELALAGGGFVVGVGQAMLVHAQQVRRVLLACDERGRKARMGRHRNHRQIDRYLRALRGIEQGEQSRIVPARIVVAQKERHWVRCRVER